MDVAHGARLRAVVIWEDELRDGLRGAPSCLRLRLRTVSWSVGEGSRRGSADTAKGGSRWSHWLAVRAGADWASVGWEDVRLSR